VSDPRICRDCAWFVVLYDPRPDEPSEYACRQPNWAGYVMDPDKSECSGVAFVRARAALEVKP
jgi:hypothetical protein